MSNEELLAKLREEIRQLMATIKLMSMRLEDKDYD